MTFPFDFRTPWPSNRLPLPGQLTVAWLTGRPAEGLRGTCDMTCTNLSAGQITAQMSTDVGKHLR